MLPSILASWVFLGLGIIFIQLHRCSWAAASRFTGLKLTKTVKESGSSISGDKVLFDIHIKHVATSQVEAVDAVLHIKLPLYLRLLVNDTSTGLVPTSFEHAAYTLKFKFDRIGLSQFIHLKLTLDIDPYFMHGKRENVFISSIVDFWYYGKDGPCARPPSLFNAKHEQVRLNVDFLACRACDRRIESTLGIPILDHQYFASSFSPGSEAHNASLSKPGVWLPAGIYSSDRNQFLQIDFERLIRITKIATRGRRTPSIAFVRTFHLYYSKNLIEWDSYREEGQKKEFKANYDGTNLASSFLHLPINARYIRIVPRTWRKLMALKVQVYGCPVHPNPKLTDFCPLFDFESGIRDWSKTGTAFDNQPTIGDNLLARTGQSANFEGRQWIATAENRSLPYLLAGDAQGDEPTGTMTSPEFLIAASKLFFLIGGTADQSKARAELLVDGAVVRTASGEQESLTEKQWDVSEFIDKVAVLRLVDDATDGHLNFDALRINCHLDADAENITLPVRSILLNPSSHSFYVCDSTHLRHKDVKRCRMTGSGTSEWFDLPGVLGLLGVDKSSNKLYGISKNRRILVSSTKTGRNWQFIKRSEWEEVKLMPTMILATEVVVPSDDGGGDKILVALQDENNGDQWRANSSGISFKSAGQSWIPIASWLCQVSDAFDDPCVSEPCQYSTKCARTGPGQYNCTCLPGYTGVDCEQEIDECQNHDCLNNASCVDSVNKFFCMCKYGYSGEKCEKELPPCRTFPCNNGATCVNLDSGNFRCDCPSGIRGSYCEIVSDLCESFPCVNGGECVPEGGTSYYCICPYTYYGTKCEHVRRTNFEVIDTKTTTETNSYLVIKARIPSDGKSLKDTWCEDYKLLCQAQGNRRPTGLGRSYNHIEEHANCQNKYFSLMDHANALGATPNTKVAELAQRVGFSQATANNSFAFNMCDDQKCTKTLPDTGCDQALSCINKAVANQEVYTVCVEPDHQLRVTNQGWTAHLGINVLIATVQPTGYYSKHASWCRDYQIMCDSYGLRPLGERPGPCQEKYNAFEYPFFGRDGTLGASRKVEYVNRGFNMLHCDSCDRYIYWTSSGLYYLNSYSYKFSAPCAAVKDTAFKVLDQKSITYEGFDYLAIKAQVPTSGTSQGNNWCKDYQTLCESYGKIPVGCGKCGDLYNASSSLGCPPSGDKIKQVVNAAGFSEANETNSFAMNDCNECSSDTSSNTCTQKDLFCLNPDNSRRVLYTLCFLQKKSSVSGVLKGTEARYTVYQSHPYLVIKTSLPSNGWYDLENWCKEYQQLCESYGVRPTGCGASYTSDSLYSSCRDNYGSVMSNDNLGCGSTSQVVNVALSAGYSGVYSYNTFAFHQCSASNCQTQVTYNCYYDCVCHPALGCLGNQMYYYSRDAYAVCDGHTTAFEVLETKQTTFKGNDVLVVKARLPSDGKAVYENWCEEYRRLCLAHGFRPTGCGEDYSTDIGYLTCRSRYQAVMSETNDYNCPPHSTVKTIANSVGFASADSSNSFAFSDCSKTCVKTLTSDDSSLIDISVANLEVYTVCSSSNSNFKVISNREARYSGGQYLFVEALVPSDYMSKHQDWCTDYQRMCESYGLRPVGREGYEGSTSYSSCIRRHGAVNPKYQEATHPYRVQDLADFLGYHQAQTGNSFVYHSDCDTACYNDMSLISQNSPKSMHELYEYYIERSKYRVYTVCASSDSNFHVLSTKTIVHDGQNYLVVMAKLPVNGESKYESWCKDYERLCRTFSMRPTGCGLSYQWSSKYRSCVEKFQSAMVENDPLSCNSSQNVSQLANMAGFNLASPNNSFMFHQCSEDDFCPKKLTSDCPESLSCLNNQSDIVYTVCTDSSSAFTVHYTSDTRARNSPLLLIGASLPTVREPRNENWCVDYQKLCESFAARPTGCDADKHSNKYQKCSANSNAISLKNEVQGCDDTGKDDIYQLKNSRPQVSDGEYFKFGSCADKDCTAKLSDASCHNSLYCLQKEIYPLYTVCSRSSSNFKVITTKSTSYGELEDIVVIKAEVPVDGKSLYDTWCEDYEKVCSVYGRKPVACPRRTDYSEESRYRSCERDFHGYMINDTSLTCPLNDFVVTIAKQAGFQLASTANSFGLSTCDSCAKKLQLITDQSTNQSTNEGNLSLSCPPNAVCSQWTPPTPLNSVVYMLCAKPQVSSFVVLESKKFIFHGRKFAAFRLSVPSDGKSKIGDWCADYKKLCESVSMRPIGCGNGHAHEKSPRACRMKYNALMLREFPCPPTDSMLQVVQAAGFVGDLHRTFGMYDCDSCGADLVATDGLRNTYYSEGIFYTACANSDSNFEVLQTRNVTVGTTSYLVIKAQLPENMLSSHESWCRDYQMMCESYGKRPLFCSGIDVCKFTFNALPTTTLKCGDDSNLESIPKAAGFSEANKENTFILHSCGSCSRHLFNNTCGPLGCLNPMTIREVYTMCVSSNTAYDVIATKEYLDYYRHYLAVRVKLPSPPVSKGYSWCHDYRDLCKEFGYRPVACLNDRCIDFHGAMWLGNVCPITSTVSQIASYAGMTMVPDTNSFAFSDSCLASECKKTAHTANCTSDGKFPLNCYDSSLNDGEFTTLCARPRSTKFPVIDFKSVSYAAREYLVVRTRKEGRQSKQSNWCHDYNSLCDSFRMRPLACPAKYLTKFSRHNCVRGYSAVSMENVDYGCPLNEFVAELAQLAGFTAATPWNSFAFNDCKDDYCKNILPEQECNEGLDCLNAIGAQQDLYTVCVSSDSAFTVLDYKRNVAYSGRKYEIIKVAVQKDQRSLHEDWCQDYQRLCQSFNTYPIECYEPASSSTSDICTDAYGAQRLPCGTEAYKIVVSAGFSDAKASNTFVMHRCTDCPKKIPEECSDSLNCLRSGTLYAVCYRLPDTAGELKRLQARSLTYGKGNFLLLQTHLLYYRSRDWRLDYINLCKHFNYLPIACGKTSTSTSSSRAYCVNNYNVLSSEGDDFSCPPSDTIALLARQIGFHDANKHNSFALNYCAEHRSYYSYQYLPTGYCYGVVWCLQRYPPNMIVYTMCAKPAPTHHLGFVVLDRKPVTFRDQNYLAIKVKIDPDGVAFLDNWCYEYRELCRQFNMVPTGCGREKENNVAYSTCRSKYNSYMAYSNHLKCGNVEVPSEVVRRAGFPDANTANTFVFNSCGTCTKYLSPASAGCDSALYCLHKDIWHKQAYTLCVNRSSGFEVLSKRKTTYKNLDYLVIQTALPGQQALHDNWCQDYQKLCHSFGQFPVACSIGSTTRDTRRYAEKYGAVIVEDLACPPATTVGIIAKSAGYSDAKRDNSFVFTDHSPISCPKYLPTAGCASGLNCLNFPSRVLYTVCTNPTNFEISDIRNTRHSNKIFTVVKARLPANGLAKAVTWCQEYANLCQTLKQQPLACKSLAGSTDYKKCAENYDAYMLSDEYNCHQANTSLYQIPLAVGFSQASFANTLALKACSSETCQNQLHGGPECDPSLNCINRNVPGNDIYALCLKEAPQSNFAVQETKEMARMNVLYLAIRARVPSLGKSKRETWCKDYERMCLAYEMRPVQCSSQQEPGCMGQFNALVAPAGQFDCNDNTKLVQFLNTAGFTGSSSENSFIYGPCSSSKYCRKTLNPSQCDSSMNCLKASATSREVYTVCARSLATSYIYHEARRATHNGAQYLVIKASLPSDRISTNENWCYDYREMCVSFGQRPVVAGSLYNYQNYDKFSCYTLYNATSTHFTQSALGDVAKVAGFDANTCIVTLNRCQRCFGKTLNNCPFHSCSTNCKYFYLVCL